MFEKQFYYNAPLTGIEADVISDVTITEIVPADRFHQAALVRVGRVIKGEPLPPTVKVVTMPTSCGPHLDQRSLGTSGIVAGKIVREKDGTPVLMLQHENEVQMKKRLGLP